MIADNVGRQLSRRNSIGPAHLHAHPSDPSISLHTIEGRRNAQISALYATFVKKRATKGIGFGFWLLRPGNEIRLAGHPDMKEARC